jgi:hypothetical protein
MNRYQNSPTIDTTKNIPYYNTVIPITIPQETIPFYYVSQEGDRWDSLSNIFYKTPNYWWVLAQANKLANGSITIPPGTKLFIPNL